MFGSNEFLALFVRLSLNDSFVISPNDSLVSKFWWLPTFDDSISSIVVDFCFNNDGFLTGILLELFDVDRLFYW